MGWIIFGIVILIIGVFCLIFSIIDGETECGAAILVLSGLFVAAPAILLPIMTRSDTLSYDNVKVDYIVETPDSFDIYFDDNRHNSVYKNEKVTIIKGNTFHVKETKAFKYSYEIPSDPIGYNWQPYSLAYED